MWSIKITQIETFLRLSDALVQFSLDSPKVGQKFNASALPIAGWALGAFQPVSSIIVEADREPLITIPVNARREDIFSQYAQADYPWVSQAGFFYLLTIQRSPGPVELILSVQIEEELIPVGKIKGELETNYIPVQTKFSPIILTCQGRTGTTLLMQILSAHPEITTSQIYPFEIRLAQHLIKTLSNALSFNASYLLDPYIDYLHQDFASSTATYFLQQIDAFYARVAQINGQPEAHYYVEKFLLTGLQDWFCTLYPQTAKEIFLVRDFRDVFASILAFNAKRGYDGFSMGRYETDIEMVNWQSPVELLRKWQKRQDKALLVRYEDLLLNNKSTLTKIFEFLQVDSSSSIVNTISTQSVRLSLNALEHATSISPEASIGRWQKEFSPQLITTLHESVGEALAAFGYEIFPDESTRFRSKNISKPKNEITTNDAVICLAGMHRAGSSMIARLLNHCGLYLGQPKDYAPPANENPEGFWENSHFVRLNEEILTRFEGAWDHPPVWSSGWETDPRLLSLHSQVTQLVQSMDKVGQWGWKDPRNSLTLPFWRLFVPNPKIIICLRDPLSVFYSLKKRSEYITLQFSGHLWYTYYQQLLACTLPQERIITHYDTYFYNGPLEIERLLNFIGLPASAKLITEACDLINADLKHYHHSTVGQILESGLPEKTKNLYLELITQVDPANQTVLYRHDRVETPISSHSFEGISLEFSDTLKKHTLLNQLPHHKTAITSLILILKAREEELAAAKDALEAAEAKTARLSEELQAVYGSRAYQFSRQIQIMKQKVRGK